MGYYHIKILEVSIDVLKVLLFICTVFEVYGLTAAFSRLGYHLNKGDNSSRIVFVSLKGKTFYNEVTLTGKNLLSLESKFFPLRVTICEKGGKYSQARVISLEQIAMHYKYSLAV